MSDRVAPIQPTSQRLLEVLRSALSGLAASAGPNELRLFTSADLVIQELLLRERSEFLQEIYDKAYRLVERGRAFGSGAPATAATVELALPERPAEHANYDAASSSVHQLLAMLRDIVNSIRHEPSHEASQYIADAIAFEQAIHGRYSSQTHSIARAPAAAPLDERLRTYFVERFDEFDFLSMRQLPGGYTKTTVSVNVRDRAGKDVGLIVRAEKPPSQLRFDASDVREEFQIIKLVETAGIPVAHPIRLEESREAIGQPFIVTTRATGRNYGAHTGASDIPEAVVRSMVETLARIHRVPLDSLRSSPLASWLQHSTLADNTRENVRRWLAQPRLPKSDASPALARLGNWLLDQVSDENIAPTLLHVDYGPHNILAEADGVTAVLDWETCRIGDPAEDVAYLIQTTQGSVAREDILTWYHRAGGAPISEYRLRYFDVFTLLKFTAGTLAMAALVQEDERASILHAEGAVLWWAHLADIEPRIRHAEAAQQTGGKT